MSSLASALLPISRDAIVLGRVPLVELNSEEDVANQLATAFQAADKVCSRKLLLFVSYLLLFVDFSQAINALGHLVMPSWSPGLLQELLLLIIIIAVIDS